MTGGRGDHVINLMTAARVSHETSWRYMRSANGLSYNLFGMFHEEL